MAGSGKKWTVMVYMAGDNSLDANGVTDLKEMKKTGSTADVNVIAQFDRAGAGLDTRRYFLRKGTTLDADALKPLGEINTGDPDTLIDFIRWGVTEYPAERYLLVLWNHGAGWDDTDIYAQERKEKGETRLLRTGRIRHAFFKTSVEEAARLSAKDGKMARAILFDDNAKDFLDNKEMKAVMEAAARMIGRKLDIVGMDACLMSMAEVGYQMSESVCYLVGSEETEPEDGWPYDSIIASMAENPGMSPAALGKIIVQNYCASYKGYGVAVTQSVCDLSASKALAAAVKKLASSLKTGLTNKKTLSAIVDARNRVQDYEVRDNVDLLDLCRLLTAAPVAKAIKDACAQVVSAVQGASGMVVASGYCGAKMKGSSGVAVYFPTRDISPLYSGLDFKKTGWGAFLKGYISATRGS